MFLIKMSVVSRCSCYIAQMRISNRFPVTLSKRVTAAMSDPFNGSSIRWHGCSCAASVPSEAPKEKKSRRRVSKAERRAMVDTFVDKFRAMNSGKFPTASDAKKEVGGSYYSIRAIVQELQYKSEVLSSAVKNNSLEDDNKTVISLSNNSEEILRGHLRVGAEVQETPVGDKISPRQEVDVDHGTETDLFLSASNHFNVNEEVHEDTLKNENFSGKEIDAGNNLSFDVEDVTCSQINDNAGKEGRTKSKKGTSARKQFTEASNSSKKGEKLLSWEDPESLPINDGGPAFLTEKTLLHESTKTEAAVKQTLLDEGVTTSSPVDKSKETQHQQGSKENMQTLRSHPEQNDSTDMKIASECINEFDAVNLKAEQQGSSALQNVARESPSEPTDDGEPQKESSVWKNLKSLAGGILSLWRKL